MTQAYPLYWPLGQERTAHRKGSKFRTNMSSAIKNVQTELRRFGDDTRKRVTDTLISSNVTLQDSKPRDPGVAVYFKWDGIDCCLAVDIYSTPVENLQAIAKVLDAERTKLRHGGLNVVKFSFRGYAALPPPRDAQGNLPRPWWQTLGVSEAATLDEAKAAYTEKVKAAHPDRGGDAALFSAVVEAWRQAQLQARQQ